MESKYSGRFGLLLVALLVDLLVSPFVESRSFGRILFNIFSTVVLFSALYSISENKRRFYFGLLLWVPAIAGVWLGNFASYFSSLATAPILSTFFLIYTAYWLLRYILRSDEVTSQTIFAALCVYLLLGVIWSYFHFGLEVLQPGSYRGLGEAVGYSEGRGSGFLYHSFVTLTTLGYGDITPVSPAARSFSYVEALMGQLYLAVLIARLVGMHIAHSMKE